MARFSLVTGGCRSGKSFYALTEAKRSSATYIFLATCPRGIDGEMNERIKRHRLERQVEGDWITLEEETELARAISSCASMSPAIIVVDCLSLWVNNLLYRATSLGQSFSEEVLGQKCQEVVHAATTFPGEVIFVSSEVGLGLVPENRTGRIYRDLLGLCNRLVAAQAGKVVLMVSGVPLVIKEDAAK